MKDRRQAPPPEPLPPGFDEARKLPPASMVRDPRTGLYTMTAIQEFIRYEIDGGAQTERNERFVTPVCVVAIGIEALPRLPDDAARGRLVDVVGTTLARLTRRSDRLAQEGHAFVALLRRTLSRRARDFYAPHQTGAVVESSREYGYPTMLCFGIASLTEHLVKDPADMIRKAFVALEHAKQKGPGSVVVYDLREMD